MRIYREYFGKRLREALVAAKITGAKLAEETDVAPPSVSRWINGQDFPDDERLPKIIKALGVPRTYFDVVEKQRKIDFTVAAAFLADYADADFDTKQVILAVLYDDMPRLREVSRDGLHRVLKLLSSAKQPK